MLPGFRFLFAATLLSVSILVFGLGATALLRSTHEQFVSNPSWRTGPQEQVFAQLSEPVEPVLAVLRAEPAPPAEPASVLRDDIPTIALPVSSVEQATALPPEPAARTDTPAAEPTPTEPPASALTAQDLAIVAAADSPAPAALPASQPETIAPSASPDGPQQASAAPAAPEPASTPTKVAALGEPATASSEPATGVKATSEEPEKATKRRAHRAKKKRRVVRRPPPPVQPSFDLFATQPTVATATTTRTR